MINNLFIENNTNINLDTESDTSTTSEAEEFSFLNNKLIELRESLIQPINGQDITVSDEFQNFNVIVNDSFEITFLRILHLFLNNNGVLNFDHLKYLMDLNVKTCNELFDFLLDNPGIMYDKDFYSSLAGKRLREKWICFLSNKSFFNYMKNNSYQIYPSIDNFYAFIKNYFPKINIDQNFPNEQVKLNYIYNKLNFKFDSVRVIYGVYNKITDNIIHSGQIQNININGFDMFILEYSNVKEITSKDIKMISSHCDFRYN